MNSFNMDKYKNSTILAGYIHDLILQNINYNLSSFVLVRANPYNTIFFPADADYAYKTPS